MRGFQTRRKKKKLGSNRGKRASASRKKNKYKKDKGQLLGEGWEISSKPEKVDKRILSGMNCTKYEKVKVLE